MPIVIYPKNQPNYFSGENVCLQSCFSNFEGSTESFVVIREKERLRIYSENGEEYFVSLPISLKTMWKSAFGLILEGLVSSDPSVQTPKLLVVHHPLEDFTRIVSKSNKKGPLSEWSNNRHRLLMVSQNPSLIVSYDSELGLHSVWSIRKCEGDDLEAQDGAPDVIGTPMMRHSFKQDSNILMPLFNTSRTSLMITPKDPFSRHTTPQSTMSSRSVSFAEMKSGKPTPNASISQPSSFDVKSGKPTPNTSLSNPSSPSTSATTLAKICRSPSMIHHDAKSRIFASPPPTTSAPGSSDSLSVTTRNPEEPLPPDISLCMVRK